MKTKYQHIILTIVCSLITPYYLLSQGNDKSTISIGIDVNTILVIIAGLLILPIYYTGKVYVNSVRSFVKKGGTKVIILILVALNASNCIAQTESATHPIENTSDLILTYGLISLIIIELILIILFSEASNKLLIDKSVETVPNSRNSSTLFSSVASRWKKMNNFIPIHEEKNLDTGHNYDGIRELDNVTPPWFTAAFLLSIMVACIYFYRFHISHSAPTQIEEYEMDVKIATMEQARYLDQQSNAIDENSIQMMADNDIKTGQQIFIKKCAVCHGENGASMPGGVGPNLTDNYWLHGGQISDIFKTIKYGYPEKGMISWKDQIPPKSMAQIASFIKSIAGTNIAGGKDPQGDEIQSETPKN